MSHDTPVHSFSLTHRSPPRGISRTLFHIPIWLYRWHLGWVLGNRFLLLEHQGRKSGQWHQTVLEVVQSDRQGHQFIIASGYGEQSDWFRNIQHSPTVRVTSGRWHGNALATRLAPEAAQLELEAYAKHHPVAMRELARFMTGRPFHGQPEDFMYMAQQVPLIQLTPQ